MIEIEGWKIIKKCIEKALRNESFLTDEEWQVANRLKKEIDKKIEGLEKQTILVS